MKILLFGATGMVGTGVLLECLGDDRVTGVTAIGRSPSGRIHPKLTDLPHKDFLHYESLQPKLTGYDAYFFCLGVSSLGLDEAAYTRITYDYTLAAARACLAADPAGTFCYVSGAGTDSTERGRSMWARVKGRTENDLLALGFRKAYMLRPGFIQPVKGVRSKTGWYQAFYTVLTPVSPVVRSLFPGLATTTSAVGRAMIRLGLEGYSRPIVTTRDINLLASET
jgi:uncharacterized protein YbjT (DUF2867 family)